MKNELSDAVREAQSSDEVPDDLVLAFAPLHKRAFGMAVGTVAGVLIFLITAVAVLFPEGRAGGVGLLSQYFAGFSVTWPGAFAGLAWGWFVGFVFGWFTAFSRNFLMAAQIFVARAREELRATRDFLDHV